MSTVCGQVISWTGRYKAFAVARPCLLMTGLIPVTRMHVGMPTAVVVRNMAICGCGIGIGGPGMTRRTRFR
jgi:hypothetical protein